MALTPTSEQTRKTSDEKIAAAVKRPERSLDLREVLEGLRSRIETIESNSALT